MKVLQLCSKVPFPARDGGCKAMLNLAEMLHANGIETKLLLMETFKHPIPAKGFPQQFSMQFKPEWIKINTKPSLIKAFINLVISKQSYNLSRFITPEFQEKLIAVLREFKPDIIILDSLFSCGYINVIKVHSSAKVIYRAHNIEHLIWKESATSQTFLKKWYLQIQSKRLELEENDIIKACDGILAITANDLSFIKNKFPQKPHMLLPFTIDIEPHLHTMEVKEKSLYFIGAMDWFPNLEGITWFIDKVWDMVKKQHPDAILYIAGKSMPDSLKNLESKGIQNAGEVQDVKKYTAAIPIMIAPVFSGGGLKIKIIEAMSMSKIVICNKDAAQGIPVQNNHSILFADSPEEFAQVINECFNMLREKLVIGNNAKKVIEENFSAKNKAVELHSFLNKLKRN